MRFVSFEIPSIVGPQVRVGALDGAGRIVDLAAALRCKLLEEGLTAEAALRVSAALIPADMVGVIEGGARSLDAARETLDWVSRQGSAAASGLVTPGVAGVRMLAPIPRPPMLRDFMAFEQHLLNIFPTLGRESPPEWYHLPVYYKGNPGSVATHGDDVPSPSYGGEALDIEFELAFVIGRGGADILESHAREHIFGLMIYNDFSERTIQAREMSVGLGPAKGKDFHRAHVLGPALVTLDEIPDVYDLRMTARVNGETWCDSSSKTIHWTFEQMIAHVSRDEVLRAGEVLGSGTVGGGSGAERGTLLRRGDVVELEVERLGILRNRVV